MTLPKVFLTRQVRITDKVVTDFIEFSGDRNRLHTDDEWAAVNSKFNRRIAHGAILNAFVSKFITESFGDGTIYVEQLMRFKRPVYIGDEITIQFSNQEPIKKLLRFNTDIILTETEYYQEDGHQFGVLVATGHAVILNTPVAQLKKVIAQEAGK